MKKLIRPACLLFYLLSLLSFFVVGLVAAGLMEAGKNQGLAGGAIVLGWGVLFGIAGLVISFFIAYRLNTGILKRINIILAVILLGVFAIAYFKYQSRSKEQMEIKTAPQKPTAPANSLVFSSGS
ncbi:MAG: hypothetical protein AAF361_13725 [Bacteroidota bacterium]